MLHKSFLNRIRWKTLTQPWQELDWILLLLVISMTAIGSLAIHSAASQPDLRNYWWQHLMMGGIGLLVALIIARWRYENLIQWRWIIYAATNVALVLTHFVGTTANGAQSWLSVGDFFVQPAEFAKIGVIITLAAVVQEQSASTLITMLRALAVAALPWILVMLEPDLGTSLIFMAVALGMLYWANAKLGWLVLLVSPLISAILFAVSLPVWLAWVGFTVFIGWKSLPWAWSSAFGAGVVNLIAGGLCSFGWQHILKAYQRDRLTLFLDPDKDPLGGGYHLIQSRIAIGAGQLFGRGLNQGTQTQLNFIPEQHTDFIFSAVGEEFGFVGCIAVLLLFWLICLRLVIIAQNAKDNFGSLLAIGVLSMIVFQVTVNVGMTIGLAPITGIPLPWISYGRSALMTNFIAIGIVESVHNHRHRLKF
jgi:rod shape determining protein RodA